MLIVTGLATLSGLGLLISLYFTLVYYRLMKPDQWFIPPVCRMKEGTCRLILQTREAQLLRIPNSLPGILFYGSVLMFVVVDPQHSQSITLTSLVISSFFAVLMSAYLAYALVVNLKIRCVLCFTAHGANLAIMILLLSLKNGN